MLIVVFSSRFVGGWASVLGKRVHLPPLDGQVYIVTGGSRGVGWQVCVRYAEVGAWGSQHCYDLSIFYQVAARLVEAGATVVITSRSSAEAAARAIGSSRAVSMTLDLESFGSIRSFTDECLRRFGRLDGLVLNGGIAKSFLDSNSFGVTAHGFESMIGVNYLGNVQVCELLLPLLRATPGARVIAMTSTAAANSYPCGIDYGSWRHRTLEYTDWAAYGQSKLALALYVKGLQKREPFVLALACHPGVASTGLTEHRGRWLDAVYAAFVYGVLGMRLEKMALSPLYCLVTEGLTPGGVYHPVGRSGFLTHWYQRMGALQMPVPVTIDHPDLWGRTQDALREAEALNPPAGRSTSKPLRQKTC